MKPILIFDINETLLDLAFLDPLFERIFKDPKVRAKWFSQFIQNACVNVITNSYQPFGKIGIAALEMIANKKGVELTDDDKTLIMNTIKHLPPHSEVQKALKKLKTEGFRMSTLTNSTEAVAKEQIENAGLNKYFEHIISADIVKKLKPAKEPYLFVAQKLNVQTSNLMLIASHSWDIEGALSAGYSTAFIARSKAVLNPLSPQPDIIGKDLSEITDVIVKLYK